MFKKTLSTLAVTALLGSGPVLADEGHHPDEAGAAPAPAPDTSTMPGKGAMGPGGGMMMPGVQGGQGGGRPGMMNKGMMGQGMMGKGMMGKGMMGKGMMGKGMMGKGMMAKHQELVRRLDLMDARLAKIEAMLERLLQR